MPTAISRIWTSVSGEALVVAAAELLDVAPQVLRAHPMIRPVVATFQHGPKALDAIGVGLAPDILTHVVPHGLMIHRISGIPVCVQLRARPYPLLDE